MTVDFDVLTHNRATPLSLPATHKDYPVGGRERERAGAVTLRG